ncbi:MAG: ABC transporter ATP-binding protein [Anaerolineales bacterium]|nr:ABC transporter ATP-binding protein [Anaerolineales bacterium]
MTARLEVTNLRKDFEGLMAVFDVSFSVEAREIVSLIGPNGAGKTTIFNMISGILPSTGGTIQYGENELGGLKPHAISALGLARTFQNLRLFGNMTALENVMIGRHGRSDASVFGTAFRLPSARRQERAMREAAMRQLEKVGLAGKADSNALSLPFGQQRLLEIARALATEPSLLLLDEAGSGLNRPEKEELDRLIREIRDSGVAILLVEHDIPFVTALSDRIVVLEHGMKIADGTPAEIRSDERVIAAYLGEDIRDLC